MGCLTQDLRHGARLLFKSPGFALAAILVLALGIGANTAIFSVVKTVLLEPLPFPNAERLVRVWHVPPAHAFPGVMRFAVSAANYLARDPRGPDPRPPRGIDRGQRSRASIIEERRSSAILVGR